MRFNMFNDDMVSGMLLSVSFFGGDCYNIIWLVVWNMFYFPYNLWDVILPIDELHHFSRWLPSGKLTVCY
jgi:hypothetical protein